jgi:hypothetical protein
VSTVRTITESQEGSRLTLDQIKDVRTELTDQRYERQVIIYPESIITRQWKLIGWANR